MFKNLICTREIKHKKLNYWLAREYQIDPIDFDFRQDKNV
jgi:hypothetical protein